MVDFPIKNCDFPCYVSLPEGTYGKSPLTAKSSTYEIAIFHSYVKLLDGTSRINLWEALKLYRTPDKL